MLSDVLPRVQAMVVRRITTTVRSAPAAVRQVRLAVLAVLAASAVAVASVAAVVAVAVVVTLLADAPLEDAVNS